MQDSISERSLNLLDYFRIFSRYRWMLVGMCFASVLVTGIVSKLSTKLYVAEATLYPIREEPLGGSGISFGNGGGKEKGSGPSSLSMAAEAMSESKGVTLQETLQAILASRLMAETVAEQLGLIQYYGTDSKSAAASILRGQVEVKLTKLKTLSIRVETKDPHMAAAIANTYFSALDEVYRQYTISNTRRNIAFIESRLADKSAKLEEAENTLKAFRTENKVLGTLEEAGGTLVAAAQIHAQIVEGEVELAGLKEYALPSHPMIKQLHAQIQELRNQIDHLDRDQAQAYSERRKRRLPLSQKVYTTVEDAPAVMLEYLRLTRKVRVEEAVYSMLVSMLEKARLAVARDIPTIQILDQAVPPMHHSKPKTLQNVLVAAAVALLLGVFLALFLNYLETLKFQETILSPGVANDDNAHEVEGNGSKKGGVPVTPKEMEQLPG